MVQKAFYPLIRARTCMYQGLRNISFSEYFAYVLNDATIRSLSQTDLCDHFFQISSTCPTLYYLIVVCYIA